MQLIMQECGRLPSLGRSYAPQPIKGCEALQM